MTLLETPLSAWHASHSGRMVDFAGWSMPVQYTSIVTEHEATRSAVGLFDISHMGRITFEGPGAEAFLDHLLTRRVAGMTSGQVRYALVTKDDGGILDDVLISRLPDAPGQPPYLLVVNASNRQKILSWIETRLPKAGDVKLVDLTKRTAMIAVQGPKALDVLRPLCSVDPESLKYYTTTRAEVGGASAIVSRTGYTGEDGWELIVPSDKALAVWEALVAASAPLGGMPAGLGSRDTLRLEAAMPLYGHELSEEINPIAAGLKFAVDLPDHQFAGHDALVRSTEDKNQKKRIGLALDGKRVPREGYPIELGGKVIGVVTSGTFSPTLNRPIAMGYVDPSVAQVGGELEIDIRGRREKAQVVKLPFYKRKS